MNQSVTGSVSQTLSRGLTVLEYVCAADEPPSIAQVAQDLGVHRSVAYRLLRTLESHYLVRRDAGGKILPAVGLTNLARGVENALQTVGLPVLTRIADELEMSCFIVVAQGIDCFTLVTVEPHTSHAVTQHAGTRHHLDRGGPGIALMAGLADQQRDEIDGLELSDNARQLVAKAQRQGYATSEGAVIAGVGSVAVPLIAHGQLPASLAVVYPYQSIDEDKIARVLQDGAKAILQRLGSA